MAQIRVRATSTWTQPVAKVYDGTSWLQPDMKFYDGTAWVSLTPLVSLTGAILVDTSVTIIDSEVGYQLDSIGRERSYEGIGNPYSLIANWLRSGANSDYDCRLTVDSGTAPIGSATGVWLVLSSTRSWTLTDVDASGPAIVNSCTIEIRLSASPFTVLSTATVTMSVQEEA